MARSTPGTRFRRELVKDLQRTRKHIDWVNWIWTRRGTSTVYISPEEREPGSNAYLRPRRPEEYPENNLNDLKASWAQVDAAISELVAIRARLADRWHELKGGE